MKLLAVRYSLPLLTLAVLIGIASPALAIALGQIDDFQDGGLANWEVRLPGNTFFTNVPDAGPLGVGDSVLDVDNTNRFIFYNESQWTGDYTAAGVTKISMDVRHQNDFPLQLRLGIAKGDIDGGGSGDTYVTNETITVPNDGQWRRITFGVTAADFVPSAGNPPVPPPNIAAALTGVTHLRILHNANPTDFVGETQPGSIRVNNILAEGATENADFDGDDDVDGADFLIWQRGLGVGTTQPAGDADDNGSVNALDLAIWKAQFGGGAATPATVAIPEPAAGALALSSLAGIFVRRRRS
jgi:hypothetical protein